MKELLKKYYNLNIEIYKSYEDGIIFTINGINYYFTKCDYDEEYLKYLETIVNKNYNLKLHRFVYTKKGSILADNYVLLELHTLIDDIDLYDIRKFQTVVMNEFVDKYITMDKFWEDKIDYLERQLTELSSNKLINNSFDYFLGISEILITFLKKEFNKENIKLCNSHRCLNSLSTIDFYNPLNICIDYYLKDYIGYIRFKNDDNLLYEVVESLNNKNDYGYFFVRLAFPFNYFYEVSNILIDKKSESELVKIVNNINEYENYLWKLEKLFGIYIFSWIKKE